MDTVWAAADVAIGGRTRRSALTITVTATRGPRRVTAWGIIATTLIVGA